MPVLPGEPADTAVNKVLLVLLIIIVAGKLGGDLFERIHQPAVLGELFVGIILGNLALLRIPTVHGFVGSYFHDPGVERFVSILAHIGVVLLLFEVGLEATVKEMVSVGPSSLLVAVLGVVAPMFLGYTVGKLFLPHEPWTVHLFLAAVLAATSVGITARVLQDLNQMHIREAKIVLGAAVIDDILGLVVLAVVQGIVGAAAGGKSITVWAIAWIMIRALGFFVLAVIIGVLASKHIYRWASFLRVKGVLLTLAIAWCFLIAFLGTQFGLAPIVGAFAAGLVLEEATFDDWEGREEQLEDLLRPVTTFLVPVFFVYMGMGVNLSLFANVSLLGFAAVLTIAAIIGKQICALGGVEHGLNRLAIGIGMIPRGEVGLIVASIGTTLRTPEGHPLIGAEAFSASVIMVAITTMATPPVLKWALQRKPKPAT